jgi:hypothetical protein
MHEDGTAYPDGHPSAKPGAETPPGEPGTARGEEHSISMRIYLPREIEAELAARAAAEGISLPEYGASSRLWLDHCLGHSDNTG